MKCIEVLNEEHAVVGRMLRLVEAMGTEAGVNCRLDKDDVALLTKLFESFVDSVHEIKEESALFPLVMTRAAGDVRRQLQARLFEHNQERSLIEGMRDAVMTSKPEHFAYYAARLAELLADHVRKEYQLFKDCEVLLKPENDRRIVSEFERLDAELRPKVTDVSAELEKLEKKYRRAA